MAFSKSNIPFVSMSRRYFPYARPGGPAPRRERHAYTPPSVVLPDDPQRQLEYMASEPSPTLVAGWARQLAAANAQGVMVEFDKEANDLRAWNRCVKSLYTYWHTE